MSHPVAPPPGRLPEPASGSAPAKFILLGEHAVVYGYPAIALPVMDRTARARVTPTEPTAAVQIHSHDLNSSATINEPPAPAMLEPLVGLIRLLNHEHGVPLSGWSLEIDSDVPVGRGLGSGAAVSVAVIRAVAAAFHMELSDADISAFAYEIEKYHHGTPSGIDNTVITHGRPVLFRREHPIRLIETSEFTFVVADSGDYSSTRRVVESVAASRALDPERYGALFLAIGALVERGRAALAGGDAEALGRLMNRNHDLLSALDVSSPRLNVLALAARKAGALGAKLCGAGRGGCLVALCREQDARTVHEALQAAGAALVFTTRVR
ncbi:mevalonate kinase [bacterium]|nr:mevalonate kinase [candidate division CSSED10-310 bacterium]